jgi:predicted ATPase/DNA-binding SARP family transcriptional activator
VEGNSNTCWRIELLGGLRAEGCGRVLTRFRTRKTGVVLACLATSLPHPVSRAELIERFWPDAKPDQGRQSLSQALSSLRCQFEPPGVPAGAVLTLDRRFAGLNPAAVSTDVAAFEELLRRARRAAGSAERLARLAAAVERYRGPFLAGYEESWVLPEREWLAEAFFQALLQVILLREEAGDLRGAVEAARRGVTLDPLREDAHQVLIRLLAAAGDRVGALRQHRELERLLAEELGPGWAPDAATRALVARLAAETVPAPGCGEPPQPVAHSPNGEDEAPGTQDEGSAPVTGRLAGGHMLEEERPPSGSLPLQFTRFFGREEEIARVSALLKHAFTEPGTSPLVTLTGPGGSGKTRLALEVAGRLVEFWRGAVWFVPLADLTEAQRIPDAIVSALELPPTPGVEPIEQVIGYLSRRPPLLVLDNYEHLVEEGAYLLQRLRQRLPALTCLVTSRRRLDLTGEREIPVPPLPAPAYVPGERVADLPFVLSQCSSVQLFVDRAQMVRPDFQLTKRNAASVAALCSGLEGIPLAIELAAARVSVLTPARMVGQLERRLEFLTSRLRDGTARHRTLRAALDWSYRLLTPEQQRFFARLSVFRGGGTAEAAAIVCEEPEAQERLEELRACSLIDAEEAADGGMRFRMLETLREFADEQLTAEERASLRHRHLHFFLAMADEGDPALRGPKQKEWMARLEPELDNLRAGLAWALGAGGSAEAALHLAGRLEWFWALGGHFAEGREWLRRALEQSARSGPSLARAQAFYTAGLLAQIQGEFATAASLLQESEALRRALGDTRGLAYSLLRLGWLALDLSDLPTARKVLEESRRLFEEAADSWGLALSLFALCQVAVFGGDDRSAYALAMAGRRVAEATGDRSHIAWAMTNLALVAHYQRNYEAARTLFNESLAVHQEMKDRYSSAAVLQELGSLTCDQGDEDAARAYLETSLKLCQEANLKRGIARSLETLGRLAWYQEEYDLACSRYRESLALWRELGSRSSIAACLGGLAAVAAARGEPVRATRLAGAAAALRDALGMPLYPGQRVRYEARVAAARAALGEAAFATAWAEGTAMPFEEVIPFAFESE